MTSIIIIHVIICAALIILVLIQRGRGGGLVESFQGVESMFGTKTNTFLTRATTVLSIMFFLTCLSLAVLSVRQSRSLMKDINTHQVNKVPEKQVTSAAGPQATPLEAPKKDQAQKPASPESQQGVPKAE